MEINFCISISIMKNRLMVGTNTWSQRIYVAEPAVLLIPKTNWCWTVAHTWWCNHRVSVCCPRTLFCPNSMSLVKCVLPHYYYIKVNAQYYQVSKLPICYVRKYYYTNVECKVIFCNYMFKSKKLKVPHNLTFFFLSRNELFTDVT